MKSHSKAFIMAGISFMVLNLLSCSDYINNVFDKDTPDTDDHISDTSFIVNPGSQEVRVAFENLQITLPQGIVPDGTPMTIATLDTNKIKPVQDFGFGPMYAIELGNISSFSKDLDIAIKFNSGMFGGQFENGLIAAYYDEDIEEWKRFDNFSIDSINNFVRIKTKHLTKLGWFSPKRMAGYTHVRGDGYLYIYYDISKIQSNASYNSPNASFLVGTDPHYIQDISWHCFEAYTRFKGLFPEWKHSRMEMYVEPIGGNGKVSPPFNTIYINTDLTFDKLRATCAHEMLHVVQDAYYAQIPQVLTAIPYVEFWTWWWEATAVNADRLVWGDLATYEAVEFANNGLPDNLGSAWDDCAGDPFHYQAGGFLTYLYRYRTGGSIIPLNELIKYVGDRENFSTIRTAVNNYIQILSNTTIGKEYRDYLSWAYNAKSVIKLHSSFTPATDALWQQKVYLDQSTPYQTLQQTVPNLGARCYKIFNSQSMSDSVTINLTDLGSDIEVYVYRVDNPGKGNEAKEFLKKFEPGKNSTFKVTGSTQCLDVLCFNIHKDDPQKVTLEVTSLLCIDKLNINFAVSGRWKLTRNGVDEESTGPVNYLQQMEKSQYDFKNEGSKLTVTEKWGKSKYNLEFNRDLTKIINFSFYDSTDVRNITSFSGFDVNKSGDLTGGVKFRLTGQELCSKLSSVHSWIDGGTYIKELVYFYCDNGAKLEIEIY